MKRLYGAGDRLSSRWLADHSPAHLNAAIDKFRELSAQLPEDDPLRSPSEGQLGYCLASRFSYAGDYADHDEALTLASALLAAGASGGRRGPLARR